jgi:polyisoprenoid-binding protein YceI
MLSLATPLLFFACTHAPVSDEAAITDPQNITGDTTAGEVLKLDSAQSKIEWIGTKVTGYHSGTVKIKDGELKVADGKITGGKFIMDMTSITVTGPPNSKADDNSKLQKHLHSADFFEVNTHPEAVFEITEVKPYSGIVAEDGADPRQEEISEYKVSAPSHLVSGNLTIKGITKNIEFPARINVTPGFADALAKFNIDRTMWDITYPGKPDDLIRNEIHLGISLMATPSKTNT